MAEAIQKVAVIGSGVMGAAIAAHIANSNTPVMLYDVVPEGASDRSKLARDAIEKLKKTDPAPLTHKRKASYITPANLEDDLVALGEADWIIEAIVEDVDIKKELYRTISVHRKPKTIVSSNTSTIPLSCLVEDASIELRKHFLITHFFNPPRYMRLLELVTGSDTSESCVEVIREFADKRLGKGVVDCKDTPGFIANRIGCFWMTVGVTEAIEQGISVEEADVAMGKPIGIPKTGVFGLLDLIGIDLMPRIAKAFKATLPENDLFLELYQEPVIVSKMIEDGYTGRKGKGGFYRLNTESGQKVKEVKNLETGEYAPAERPSPKSVDLARKSLRAFLEADEPVARYAKKVMVQLLGYTASLIPEMADDIVAVDRAMRMGYNWKYGPFELIDKLSEDGESGASWLIKELKAADLPVASILFQCGDDQFYSIEKNTPHYMSVNGKRKPMPSKPGVYMLSQLKHGKTPVLKNASAVVWDIGDGILCLEYISKMNSVDPMTLEMIRKATDLVQREYKGLVIANDSDNFCVGANIGVLLFAANIAAWKQIRGIIKEGQDTYMGLKYAPFPVVVATSGMALGGGCEIMLHADAVQAHVETYSGLVEVGVGVVPGWGGCKEMLFRHMDERLQSQKATAQMGKMFSFISPVKVMNVMPAILKVFEIIGTAKVSKSAELAKDYKILMDKDHITMNRERLLPDAKATCLRLVKGYQPPETQSIYLPGKTARTAMEMGIRSFVKSGKATPYDEVVSKALAEVLSGGNTSINKALSEQEILDLELDVFMELLKNKGTMDRIEYMLENNKPLRN